MNDKRSRFTGELPFDASPRFICFGPGGGGGMLQPERVGGTVNHPTHYNSHPAGIEAIEVIEHMNFNVGTAIKYLWRAGLKGDAPTEQDLRKALWYVERELKRMVQSAKPTAAFASAGLEAPDRRKGGS